MQRSRQEPSKQRRRGLALVALVAATLATHYPATARAYPHPLANRRLPAQRVRSVQARAKSAVELASRHPASEPEFAARDASRVRAAVRAARSPRVWHSVHGFRALSRRLGGRGQREAADRAALHAAEIISDYASTRPLNERSRLYVRAAEESLGSSTPGRVNASENLWRAAQNYGMAYESAVRAGSDPSPILHALQALPSPAVRGLLTSTFQRVARNAESRGNHSVAADHYLAAARALHAESPNAPLVDTLVMQANTSARASGDVVRLRQVRRAAGELGAVAAD